MAPAWQQLCPTSIQAYCEQVNSDQQRASSLPCSLPLLPCTWCMHDMVLSHLYAIAFQKIPCIDGPGHSNNLPQSSKYQKGKAWLMLRPAAWPGSASH